MIPSMAFHPYKPSPNHRKYWIRGKDHTGKVRHLPASRSSSASESMARTITDIVERVGSGAPIPADRAEWVVHKASAKVRGKLIEWGIFPRSLIVANQPTAKHLEEWEQHLLRQGNLPDYVADRVYLVRGLIERTIALAIADIDPVKIAAAGTAWGNEVHGREKRNPKKKWSPNRVKAAIGAAKAFTRWLWRFGRHPVDVLAALSRPKVTRAQWGRLIRELRVEEEEKLLAWLENSGGKRGGMDGTARATFYRAAAASGFRAAALLGLLTDHVEVVSRGRVRLLPPEGGRKGRGPAAIVGPLAVEIAALAKRRGKGVPLWGDGLCADPKWLTVILRDDCARAGVPRITFHGFRHTLATRGVAAGVHPRVLQRMLAHASSATTMAHYAFVPQGDEFAAAESVAQIVAQKSRKPRQTPVISGNRKIG